jgi:vacuolar-type H+-ATPase subunit I/STV1
VYPFGVDPVCTTIASTKLQVVANHFAIGIVVLLASLSRSLKLWKGAKNELEFYNSLKMKMSILIGLAQVSFVEP